MQKAGEVNVMGIRKQSKINALMVLNEKFDLGLTKIEDMSTNQLTRKIFEIRVKNGLTINKTSKYQPTKRRNQ